MYRCFETHDTRNRGNYFYQSQTRINHQAAKCPHSKNTLASKEEQKTTLPFALFKMWWLNGVGDTGLSTVS